MSTLERTINILNVLSENQLETIYSFAQFLSMQQIGREKAAQEESIDSILRGIVGTVPDTGKSVEDYRGERLNRMISEMTKITKSPQGTLSLLSSAAVHNAPQYGA